MFETYASAEQFEMSKKNSGESERKKLTKDEMRTLLGPLAQDPNHRIKLHNAEINTGELRDVQLELGLGTELSLYRAEFTLVTFTGSVFPWKTLRNCSFTGCLFEKSEARQTDFCGSGFHLTVFENCNLSRAVFWSVSFQDIRFPGTVLFGADFRHSSGLIPRDVASSDLTGCFFPPGFDLDTGLKEVNILATAARKLLFALLLVCGYCWLAVLTTPDSAVVSNSVTLRLPIVGSDIKVGWFYIVAPLFIVGIQGYFYLVSSDIWRLLGFLPAAFQDGTPTRLRLYPWLPAKTHHADLLSVIRNQAPRVPNLPSIAAAFLIWGIGPVTVVLFAIRYFRSGDWLGLWIVVLAAVATVLMTSMSIGSCSASMCSRSAGRREFLSMYNRTWFLFFWPTALLCVLFIVLSSLGLPGISSIDCSRADLRAARLSGLELNSTPPPRFVEADLAAADLRGAILYEPDFSYANLDSARLDSASLLGAELRGTSFHGTHCNFIDIDFADFTGAFLQRSSFRNASLRGVDFTNSTILEVDFENADLRETMFRSAKIAYWKYSSYPNSWTGANLQGADFRECRAGGSPRITAASNWLLAYFDQPQYVSDRLLADHNERLDSLDLSGYNLSGINLTNADLRDFDLSGCNFIGTILKDADLCGANLSGAEGLTVEQLLSAARADSSTVSPPFDPIDLVRAIFGTQ
jgi:uncharacterized protein YjbI with pentapeptide repeats